MSIQVRRAVLEVDDAALIELIRRHLTARSDRRRFDWLYSQNPCGPAHVWLAEDASGAAVGAAAAFPRKFSVDRSEKLGLVLGDFCLDEKYRTLGPALKLQRACLEAVAPPYEFCYDFPSQSMMAIYKRMGMSQTRNLVRWAKPLRAANRLRPLLRSKLLARGAGVLADAVLAKRGYKGDKNCCHVAEHQGMFTEEFTALHREIMSSGRTQMVRTVEYLNWRYLANPLVAYETITARRNGWLVGYTILTKDPSAASIVDLCAIDEPAVVARLIATAVDKMKLQGAATVSMAVGDGHPWEQVFEKAGFRRRESSPVVVYTLRGGSLQAAGFTKGLQLMQGDRDG